jgi:hypothetical protein
MPSRTDPAPDSIRLTRRRMNARMTISPISAEPIMSARKCAASNGTAVQPSKPARPQAKISCPASWLTSPEICPAPWMVMGISRPARSGRVTSIVPLSTSQLGTLRWPMPNTTSPGAKSRGGPLAKRLAVSIWVASSTGNAWWLRVVVTVMRVEFS